MPFTAETVSKLKGIVDGACADQKTGIPGATVVVVGRDGRDLLSHSAGTRGLGSGERMTPENLFWIASCTKMVAGVACMQLVERGVLRLDDGNQLESLLPEVRDLPVLRADGTTEKKNKAITLRMLLTHTAGFGYSFFNERVRDWGMPAGIDEFSGRFEDFKAPLLFQPGEGWEYGTNIDWAGLALERVTGTKLNDYIQKNICQPLGITNLNMFPNAEQKAKMAYMHHRDSEGNLRVRDHLQRAPLIADDKEKKDIFHSAGAGLYAQPEEYCKILAVLLNDGTCPRTGATILRRVTVEEMFKNQIASFPNFARQGIPASKPDQTNPIPEIYPVPGNPPQGWGLTFMLSNGGATGRSQSTGFWAGLANLWWWCDRENGVAGIVATQVLPFADGKVLGLWAQIESEVYQALKRGG